MFTSPSKVKNENGNVEFLKVFCILTGAKFVMKLIVIQLSSKSMFLSNWVLMQKG
jgi:hypothetical protein